MIVSLTINAILLLVKLMAGLIIKSKTLIADAVHSLSDLLTDIIAIVGQRLSKAEPDFEHPYGHGKIEYITSMVIGTLIMIIGIGLIASAINSNLMASYSINIIYILLIIIIIKFVLSRYVTFYGQKYNNNILIASGKESMADALSSIGVLITILLFPLSQYIPIFKYVDVIGCIIISAFIIKTAINILIVNINAILGEKEQNEEITERIKALILSVTDVNRIDRLNLIKYGSYYSALVYVSIDSNKTFKESHDIAHLIEKTLLSNTDYIKYAIVHVSPYKKY
jgi:cation diffusion facilitator family transporter